MISVPGGQSNGPFDSVILDSKQNFHCRHSFSKQVSHEE